MTLQFRKAVAGIPFALAAGMLCWCSPGALAQRARSWPNRIDGGEILARDAQTVTVCGVDGKTTLKRLEDLSGADRAVVMNWQAGGVRRFTVRGYRVRGRIVGQGAGKVVLRMEDGREATVATGELAPPDRAFLSRWSPEQRIPGFGQPTLWWSRPLLRCTVEAAGGAAHLRTVGGAGLPDEYVTAGKNLLVGKGLRAVQGRAGAFSVPAGAATLAGAIAREQYVAFRVAVPAGHVLDLNRVSVGFQRSSVDAPDAAALFTSVGGFQKTRAVQTVPSFRRIDKHGSVTTGKRTVTLEGRGLGLTDLTKAVQVRLYLYGPAKESETVRIVSAGLDVGEREAPRRGRRRRTRGYDAGGTGTEHAILFPLLRAQPRDGALRLVAAEHVPPRRPSAVPRQRVHVLREQATRGGVAERQLLGDLHRAQGADDDRARLLGR